jgi:hypothetical protein
MSTLTTTRAKDALKAYYETEEEKKKKAKKKPKKDDDDKFVPAMEPVQITGVN